MNFINKNYKILREKDISSVKFIKTRKIGEYHFSNLIASLIAFSYGKPITINKQLILDIKDDKNEVVNLKFINLEFIKEMLEFLYKLDILLEQQFPGQGVNWMGRETVLVAIFGALGVYKYQKDIKDLFEDFLRLVEED